VSIFNVQTLSLHDDRFSSSFFCPLPPEQPVLLSRKCSPPPPDLLEKVIPQATFFVGGFDEHRGYPGKIYVTLVITRLCTLAQYIWTCDWKAFAVLTFTLICLAHNRTCIYKPVYTSPCTCTRAHAHYPRARARKRIGTHARTHRHRHPCKHIHALTHAHRHPYKHIHARTHPLTHPQG